MARVIRYTFNGATQPADPTESSAVYTAPLVYQAGYYKAKAWDEGQESTVTSVTLGMSPTDYIAYYPFSGSTINAVTGIAATNNGATLTTDRIGNSNSAYSFDGVNDYMITPNTDLGLNGKTEFSIYFEFQSNDVSGRIIQKQIADGYSTFNIAFTSSKISFSPQNSTLMQYPTWETVPTINSNWHRVCISFKKNVINATDCIIVIDGSFVSTVFTANWYASNFVTQEVSSNLVFGARPVTISDFYSGKIDEIKIYDYALSEAEAIQLTTE